MLKRFFSLLWLRYRYLLHNKIILFVCVFTPIVDFSLLNFIPDVRGSVFLMSMAIITIYSLTAGTFTTLIISEEKDKKNLRTLILTGVKIPEYIFSTILFPFLFSIIGVWVMPITFGISIPNLALYSLVTFLTILCFILVNFTIALFCKNQTQASAVSLIFYLSIMTLPMFSSINKFAKLLTDFSLLGAHNQYFNDISAFSLYNIQILTLLLWIVLMSALVYTGFVWNKKH